MGGQGKMSRKKDLLLSSDYPGQNLVLKRSKLVPRLKEQEKKKIKTQGNKKARAGGAQTDGGKLH